MIAPCGWTTIVPPPVHRRTTVNPKRSASSTCTSSGIDWNRPTTTAGDVHSQKRTLGGRVPAATSRAHCRSIAICSMGLRGRSWMTTGASVRQRSRQSSGQSVFGRGAAHDGSDSQPPADSTAAPVSVATLSDAPFNPGLATGSNPIARANAHAMAPASVPTSRAPPCRMQVRRSASLQSPISAHFSSPYVSDCAVLPRGRRDFPADAGASPSCVPVTRAAAPRAHASNVRSRSSSSERDRTSSPSMKKSPSNRHSFTNPIESVATVTATSFPPGVLITPRRTPMAPPGNPAAAMWYETDQRPFCGFRTVPHGSLQPANGLFSTFCSVPHGRGTVRNQYKTFHPIEYHTEVGTRGWEKLRFSVPHRPRARPAILHAVRIPVDAVPILLRKPNCRTSEHP